MVKSSDLGLAKKRPSSIEVWMDKIKHLTYRLNKANKSNPNTKLSLISSGLCLEGMQSHTAVKMDRKLKRLNDDVIFLFFLTISKSNRELAKLY